MNVAGHTFLCIQVLRGLAAMMVVTLHACLILSTTGTPLSFGLGNAGVDIFFPISGFIMCLTAPRFGIGGRSCMAFISSRLRRICPMYYAATLVKAGGALLFPALFFAYSLDSNEIVHALAFLPFVHDGQLQEPPIKPGWTLNLEVFYYSLVAIAVLTGARVSLFVAGVLLLTISFAEFYGTTVLRSVYGNPLGLEFAAGAIIGELWVRQEWFRRMVRACRWGALSLALVLFSLHTPSSNDWSRLAFYGGGGVLLLLAALGFENRAVPNRGMKGLVMLGDASYAIYITHVLALPVIAIAIKQSGFSKSLGIVPSLATLIACSIIAGLVVHLGERRVLRSGSRKKEALTEPNLRARVPPQQAPCP